MGRSSAARIILEVVIRLSDAEIIAVAPMLKAVLRMHATYDPAVSAEKQLERTLRAKTQMAERARPDPLMMVAIERSMPLLHCESKSKIRQAGSDPIHL